MGVGSRSIPHLSEIVAFVVSRLKAAGADPFILPAMGSHGGGTAEGQTHVLAALGIEAPVVGAPVKASMDVVNLGEIQGIPVFINRLAHEADGLVLINRIKPHTDFTGPIESGVIKMLTVGLGGRTGADAYHRPRWKRFLPCAHGRRPAPASHLPVSAGGGPGGKPLSWNMRDPPGHGRRDGAPGTGPAGDRPDLLAGPTPGDH